MARATINFTTELISDYAADRLDAADAWLIEAAIEKDDAIAASVADARRLNSRMTIWLRQSGLLGPGSE